MMNQFSPKVSEILSFSREEAERLTSASVAPEHIMLAILEREVRDQYGNYSTNGRLI